MTSFPSYDSEGRQPPTERPFSSGRKKDLFRVVILGRPNVGKSTLFNLLTRSRRSIVYDREGVTRDWITGPWRIPGYPPLEIYDLCGFREKENDPLLKLAQLSHRALIEKADLILFVVDGREGWTAEEEWLKGSLLNLGIPVLVVINKVDHPGLIPSAMEFSRLGFPFVMVSSAHNRGIETLAEEVVRLLKIEKGEEVSSSDKESSDKEKDADSLRIAILGRPNVGKSTLFNYLTGYERSLVSPIAGTTRDPLDVPIKLPSGRAVLVDTAGIRRKSRVVDDLERSSVRASLSVARRAHLVLYLLDPEEGITEQDQRLIFRMAELGKGILLVYARWDLVRDPRYRKRRIKEEKDKLGTYTYLPHIYLSVHKEEGIEELYRAIGEIYRELTLLIPTPKINRALKDILEKAPPLTLPGGDPRKVRSLRIYYGVQVEILPQRFQLFSNLKPKEELPLPHYRFLTRELKRELGLHRIPILLTVKPKG